jgi:membrane-associated protease RseP (regulator of RpoE activity)
MSQNPEIPLPTASSKNVTTCTNCHSAMPAELRFCRNCGFRLGEGLAEYTETVRFDSSHASMLPAGMSVPAGRKKRRRMSGMAWIFVGLLVFFVCAAAFTAVVTPFHPNVKVVNIQKQKSYVGVNGFDTAEGGVTFESVDAPDSPADKAGLVGGDVITSFDGRPVHEDDEMRDLMINTPSGKTVDIEYLRDGEKKTTKLTTISQEDLRRLSTAFEKRPEGRAQFGYEDGDAERVPIPGTKIFGVKLNTILQSRPADLAGIKEGDVVVEFDGIPIRTPEEFLMRVRRALPYSTVKVVVMRGEEKLEIPVKMGKQ